MAGPDTGEGVLFGEHTTDLVGGPRFEHDAEVSLVPCVGKDHYLGTRLDRSGDPMDLYVRVVAEGGESELVARFGNDADDCLVDSLVRIYSLGAEWANARAGVERTYGIRMAFDQALTAGYDLAQVAADSPVHDYSLVDENDPEIG